MEEHPIKQKIKAVSVFETERGNEYHEVGKYEVTRIEACFKSGMHANIPYIRVWKGEHCVGEFCQHNVVGVYFEQPA